MRTSMGAWSIVWVDPTTPEGWQRAGERRKGGPYLPSGRARAGGPPLDVGIATTGTRASARHTAMSRLARLRWRHSLRAGDDNHPC